MAKDKSAKKVLGVRIPKTVRKMDWLVEILDSDLGRRVLADVLVAAAAAAAAALVGHASKAEDKADKPATGGKPGPR
jgi:hypothetical protein